MKKEMTYLEAKQEADDLVNILKAGCVRIELAGSLRRKVKTVRDIELVALPIFQTDLFGDLTGGSHLQMILDNMSGLRYQKNGEKYKQFIWREVQVDLFIQQTPKTWGVNYLLRTGDEKFSRRMVTSVKWGGFMPEGYRVKDALVWKDGEIVPTLEEEDVFKLWGMDYIEPEKRSY